MLKTLFKFFFITFVAISPLSAEIIQTTNIQTIKKEITPNTLVLFNIAEVLLDTETSLGTQQWRKYIRSRLDAKTHDELTLFVFKTVHPKAVDPSLPLLVEELQSQGDAVFAFTSRGRHEWYSSQTPNIDHITEDVLRKIGIDFSKTKLNPQLSHLSTDFLDFFHEGIIYAANRTDKGALLFEILSKTGYHPSKVILVDDKYDSLASVEKGFKCSGIPFIGYAYSRTALEHQNFDPMIANIQLDHLITDGILLTDAEAAKILKEEFFHTEPETYLKEIVEKWHALKQILLSD